MPPADPFNTLVGQDARTRKVSRMMPATGCLPPVVQAEIRAALEAHMKTAGLSQADVAEAIGMSATYVNNLLTEAASLPPATRDRMWRDINNWLEREERARAAQRPEEFVRITVAPLLFALCEQLSERADMALAFGPAGVGKTISIEAIVGEIPTAVAIRAGHETRTNIKLVNVLYAALSSARRRPKFRPTLDDVISKLVLPAKVATRALVIIDQAHELHPSAYKLLMEIHDRANCSILLVGTVDLKGVASTDDSPEFGQLSSRIGMRIDLAPGIGAVLPRGKRATKAFVTVADIRKLFAYSKLKLHPDAARMLALVASNYRGTVRRAKRLFYWAERAATRAHSDTISVQHLETAAGLVERELGLPQPVEPAADAAEAATA